MNYEEKYKWMLARQAAYRKAHKAEISAYYKIWYQENKSALAARRREKRIKITDSRTNNAVESPTVCVEQTQ